MNIIALDKPKLSLYPLQVKIALISQDGNRNSHPQVSYNIQPVGDERKDLWGLTDKNPGYTKIKIMNKNKFLLAGLVALATSMIFLCGLMVGLYFAWIVEPVEWVDISPRLMAPTYQEEYMRMAIDSFTLNPDCDTAQKRYHNIGTQGKEILDGIIANPGMQTPDEISDFLNCIILE